MRTNHECLSILAVEAGDAVFEGDVERRCRCPQVPHFHGLVPGAREQQILLGHEAHTSRQADDPFGHKRRTKKATHGNRKPNRVMQIEDMYTTDTVKRSHGQQVHTTNIYMF